MILKRDNLLDIAKGIGIILVVIGHIHKGVFTDFIYLFHMPLFFFISGAVIAYANKEINIAKSFRTIIVPYFIFSFASFFYWIIFEQRFRSTVNETLFTGSVLGSFSPQLQQFLNIFIAASVPHAFVYNIVLWFLPCLFCCRIIFQYLNKLGIKWASLICLGVPLVLFLSFDEFLILPWCFELSLISLPLMWGGYYLYGVFYNMNTKISLMVMIVAVSVIMAYIITQDSLPQVSMLHHELKPFWSFYLVAILLIYVCLELCKIIERKAKKASSLFIWLGRNSLFIMCVHGPIERVVIWVCSFTLGIEASVLRVSLLYSIIITIFTILIICPFVSIINTHIPWIIGKK